MTLNQPKASNAPSIKICKGRIRNFIGEYKPDAFMSFISQGHDFDSPINLFISEYLGADFFKNFGAQLGKTKSGDVILQEVDNIDFPDVLFAAMPIWDTALSNEEKFLSRCYRNAIGLAKRNGYKRIVLPALGKGKSNFPHRRVVRLSLSAILGELSAPIEEVIIVCAEDVMYESYQDRLMSLGLMK
jgi:hypothetical protein|tara:strand:- start:157930 stop:158490 length:561 start_codon:yes stop_codon:yes gene_type:complete